MATFRRRLLTELAQATLRSNVRTFSSGREAKEYLISQIILESGRRGVALSETERKMMYFTETAWTLPDMDEVKAAFDRDNDQKAYEAKVGRIAQGHGLMRSMQMSWKLGMKPFICCVLKTTICWFYYLRRPNLRIRGELTT
jgi:hypothetical protein